MEKSVGRGFGAPVGLGTDDLVPAVAGLAAGLAPRGEFHSSDFRRHLQTVAANLVATADLTGLPPFEECAAGENAWSERFALHSQSVANLLDAWLERGRIELLEDGRDRRFRMHPTRGLAPLLRVVVLCEEGLSAVRTDLLLLSLTLPAIYPFDLLADEHPRLRRLSAHVGDDPRVRLADTWSCDWIARRFRARLLRQRDILRTRRKYVLELQRRILRRLEEDRTVGEALERAQGELPAGISPVYPGAFAWKRQRAGDLDAGLDRLAVLYRALPEEIARRDFEWGMPLRASVLYGRMAEAIDHTLKALESARREMKAAEE